MGQQPDDIAAHWRVRFALPDGAFTFVDISAKNGVPFSKKTAWAWGDEQVAQSKGGYAGVAAVYSIDHEIAASPGGSAKRSDSKEQP